ncbi:putative cytochrome P450 110 [Microcystis aeruginosa PCC 9701]|uniref:Putative cytochrome P450 110 n=2 Tax=Microcystis aeruginosa TaxID=1126 RepID=I4IQD7_MICAE|nr:putative cytochrome P450 110 [Microcystis aeruginosa PCC 9701]
MSQLEIISIGYSNQSMKILPKVKAPTFVQMAQWIINPVAFMENAARKHGDIFSTKVGLTVDNFIFVSSPSALQQILTNDRKQFSAPGEANRIIAPIIGDYSVVMLDGDIHKKRRQLLLPPFHGERMRFYGDLIRDITLRVMAELPQNQPFKARSATTAIALQVIMEAVFGISQGERYQTLKKILAEMLDIFNSPVMASLLFFPILRADLGAWSPWGKYQRYQEKIDDIIYTEIAERKANPNPNRTDVLSLLMSARDEEGNPMSDKELRDELMTLLFAGHETTATAMSWALYWTHRYPEIKAKILQEIATLGDNPNPIDITRLPYLSAVCSETLRIHPVGMLTFPRVVQEPVELDGYPLEKGTILMGCIYLSHHREQTFPDSHTFKPERFLEKQFTPYEYMPFGGGARRCIGEVLAIYEMKIAIATILANYQLTLVNNTPEKPSRRGVTLAPSRGVPMVLKGRREPLVTAPMLAEIS